MLVLQQAALACGCGSPDLYRGDLCRRCYRRRALNRANFAGLREAALLRDDYQCQLCGELERVLVHHRRRRVRRVSDLLTLCRGCHAKVHHTAVLPWSVDGLARVLWAEVGPEQLRLPLAPAAPVVEQIELFEVSPGLWSPAGMPLEQVQTRLAVGAIDLVGKPSAAVQIAAVVV